ncbi:MULTISPECIES: ZIP family metal transporter [unclassified Pseudomonas]|uniref:ZIP family metal transporter n=1 Tax=unclassified Pseudomonas TaxID=196821 RepID=UPI00244D5976|nr:MULTISPECIES: ZIP family metal transporter [unclassified Pseudomonas]MDG9923802.1 ZIP family metal transporter [Pseudomonas sp. GD04045]MDH0035923.1 ZIP family metal transporter [Pseudomonas sp. GD04019]
MLQSFSSGGSRTLRYLIGFSLVLLGCSLLLMQARGVAEQAIEPQIWRALQGGLLCALGTALGALPVLFMRSISTRFADTLLGFGGGVMLAATVFSLLIPALDAAGALGFSKWGAGFLASLGLLIGAGALFGLGRLLPEVQLRAGDGQLQALAPNILLFVVAIILHNIPEGMAVGVSAGAGLPGADSLAMGIALQDLPEGLIISLVLVGAGMGRGKALLVGAASGLVEPLFAVLCAWLVGISALLLPWGLALAAGAMLFAVVHEIIPESHRKGYATEASLGLAAGFCLMMVMDTALG